MKTHIIPVLIMFFTFNYSFSQKPNLDITGLWQTKTKKTSSAYLDHYIFKQDGTFEFHPNEYNGLNRILELGGRYTLDSDSILFKIQYTEEFQGGVIIRSRTSSYSDSWEIIDGEIIQNNFDEDLFERASLKYSRDSNNNEFILIENRIFYKILTD